MTRNAYSVCCRLLGLVLLAALAFASCQGDPASGSPTPVTPKAIVGGSIETGWAGVGALTLRYPVSGYGGSFCTAALIGKQWLLTAAHCVSPSDEMTPIPETTFFYVGNDARPSGNYGDPTNGDLYPTDHFYIHPDYNDSPAINDVAVVHLALPVPSAEIYPINTLDLDSYIGESAFYVGFGVTNGVTKVGSGIKRSTAINIADVGLLTYKNVFSGSSVCFGDSGGPGFLYLSGAWRIIGVNSTVFAASPDLTCNSGSTHTRVDAMAAWINEVVGGEPPNCNVDTGLCHCAKACQGNGTCDNEVCQTNACRDVWDCMADCDTDTICKLDCYVIGTDEAQAKFDAVMACIKTAGCSLLPETTVQQCIDDNCGTEINACLIAGTGDFNCKEINSCMIDCNSDTDCQHGCLDQGTTLAQQQYQALNDCFNLNCTDLTGHTDFSDCALAHCEGEITTCMPPSNCDVTGGDCGDKEGCYPTISGATDCFSTNGLGHDAACDPSNAAILECADGLLCLGSGSDGNCMNMCTPDGGCETGESCELGIFTDVDDIGYCAPSGDSDTDADADGDTDGDIDSDTDRDSNGDTDRDSNGDTDSGADNDSDADGDDDDDDDTPNYDNGSTSDKNLCGCSAVGSSAPLSLLGLLF